MEVWVDPPVYKEIARLPGNVRQRIRRAITTLADDPRPHNARRLSVEDVPVDAWRLRIDRWRVIYAIDASLDLVLVFAVRKRPPYDYEDLTDLLKAAL